MKLYRHRIIKKLHPKEVVETFPDFLKDEAAGGKLILLSTVAALIAINSPLRHAYESLWQHNFTLGVGSVDLTLGVHEWISEALMVFFFLVVGLEIKRELVFGELRDRSKALLPVGAAVGGMIAPALIYLAVNHTPEVIVGWGIPIATDIAFAVAILTLLGSKVPRSLKLFLLTLAIADDIGAIFVIALFYATIINFWYLGLSAGILIALWLFRKKLASSLPLFLGIGLILWVTTHLSGIHASIVGAALGLLAPVASRPTRASISKRLEDFFHPISTFIILPLFAFASAGVIISARTFHNSTSLLIIIGVVLGLVFGKMLGIFGASWLLVKLGKAALPEGVRWPHIIGIGLIAGIGFTVSIFITELAFDTDHTLVEAAKIGIFIASILSALLGIGVLTAVKQKKL
jgi:NhaA family Na+:H+ antiporter